MRAVQGAARYAAVAATHNASAVVETPQTKEAFGTRLTGAIDQVDQLQLDADQALAELASGERVDLHGVSISLEKADIALRTMVSVRDRVISAYEQVMNMAV